MRTTIKAILLGITGTFLFAGNGFCEGLEKGRIIEFIPEASLIQVHDHTFKVGQVKVVTEKGEFPGDIHDLRTGRMVEIRIGEKKENYWEAELVTLFSGDIEENEVGDGKFPESLSVEKEILLDDSAASPGSSIKVKNGVWEN